MYALSIPARDQLLTAPVCGCAETIFMHIEQSDILTIGYPGCMCAGERRDGLVGQRSYMGTTWMHMTAHALLSARLQPRPSNHEWANDASNAYSSYNNIHCIS